MLKSVGLALAMLLWVPALQAQDLMDWLQDSVPIKSANKTAELADDDQASVLTLEPRENEMFPRVSPDGKYFLALSGKHRKLAITRRLLENGDAVNIVSDADELSFDSMTWHGNDSVSFLSFRADSLGLWKKPVIGGVVRRYIRLDGALTSALLLDDGYIIAVRMHTIRSFGIAVAPHRIKPHGFDNWNQHGKEAHLVRISPDGVEQELTAGINPSLSPDGQRVAFSMQDGKNWHLFMMKVDGSDLMQLTEGSHIDVQPTWSRDSKWIAFTSNRDGIKTAKLHHRTKTNWDIWLIGHDGRGLIRLTRNKARDGAPSFANNGRVYFHSDRVVNKQQRQRMQVKHSPKGFHIWSVALPAEVS